MGDKQILEASEMPVSSATPLGRLVWSAQCLDMAIGSADEYKALLNVASAANAWVNGHGDAYDTLSAALAELHALTAPQTQAAMPLPSSASDLASPNHAEGFGDLTLRCPECGRRADTCFDHGDDWKKR